MFIGFFWISDSSDTIIGKSFYMNLYQIVYENGVTGVTIFTKGSVALMFIGISVLLLLSLLSLFVF